jgi:hypothetical protein
VGIFGFYWKVLWEVPNIARGKAEAVTFWGGVFIALVLTIRPEMLPLVENTALARKVSLVVLGISAGVAVVTATYRVYRAVESRAGEAESLIKSEQVRSARLTALGNLRNHYIAVMNACVEQSVDIETLQHQLDDADKWAHVFVEQHFHGGEASLLNAASIQPLDLNVQALVRSGAPHSVLRIYVTAQHKAEALRDLVQASRTK